MVQSPQRRCTLLREDNSYNAFEDVINALKENINCSLPCQVEAVSGNYVDVRMIRNDDIEDIIISNVPIKREETARAYIFLGIKQGDRGTLTFYDKSIEDYMLGDEDYNYDTRTHSIQDRSFSLGFVPDPEAFVYPENTDIEIGTKTGGIKINLSSPELQIYGSATRIKSETEIILDAPSVSTSGNFNVATGYSGVVPCGLVTLTISNGIITGVT